VKAKLGLSKCYDYLKQTETAIDILEHNL